MPKFHIKKNLDPLPWEDKPKKTNPSRSFSFFRWDIYFKPEYSRSQMLDSKGRARMSGYDHSTSHNSTRLTDVGRYDKLYKSLQRVFVRNEKNYLKRADEVYFYALPVKNNPNKDVCFMKFSNGKFQITKDAYKWFDKKLNFQEVKDNTRLENQIVNYLNHFYNTGRNVEPEIRPKLHKNEDPFRPQIFDTKKELQEHCQNLMELGLPPGRCQDYYNKMLEKNNL